MRESKMRTTFVLTVVLLFAPLAQAQWIPCGAGGEDCVETVYGLGNDNRDGPYENTASNVSQGPGDGSCGGLQFLSFQGQVVIREQTDCVVSSSNRCMVEIPGVEVQSGFYNNNRIEVDLGPLGLLAALGGLFTDFAYNVGHRQLIGSCTQDGNEACALDSDCASGDGCLSTCFSTGENCASHADCPNADCQTEINWDEVATCDDNATLCTSDADCPAGGNCELGFDIAQLAGSCVCCQSSLGTVCSLFSFLEYPGITCEPTSDRVGGPRLNGPKWHFQGGKGTRFDTARFTVPNRQEGLCAGNNQRPCGALGDYWAGAANNKCVDDPPCADPVAGDDTQGALASTCDDVAFGGIAGDVCDVTENGFRDSDVDLLEDGSPNPAVCPVSWIQMGGQPNILCALPVEIPLGDPQPGCQLSNIGFGGVPDTNCDGINDADAGHCMPVGGAFCNDPALCPPCAQDSDCASGNCINNGDLCPALGEGNWFLDSNNDDIGDECQCGDGTGDGAISSTDIAAVALCANGAGAPGACDPSLIDATGDNATTAEDIGGIVSVVNGVLTSNELDCIRNPAP